MPKFFFLLGLFCVLSYVMLAKANAQEQGLSIGIANHVPIASSEVKNGDIITSSNEGYVLSSKPYDPLVIGVVSLNPAVSLDIEGDEANSYPVISAGNVEVNVSSVNGNIEEGDLITSSSIPGVGMKATKAGYILGQALDKFTADKEGEIGKINIALNLRYSYSNANTQTSLADIFNLSLLATYESPSAVFKYLVAGIVIVLAFVLGVVSFGRVANTGVEALGRNPLAGKMIQFGIIFNVLITISIIAAGFGMAYLIIRL